MDTTFEIIAAHRKRRLQRVQKVAALVGAYGWLLLGKESRHTVMSCGGEKTSSGDRTTSSLGVRKRGAAMKKKGPALAKIAEALSRIADANDLDVEAQAAEARAEKMAIEARAYEISIAGVMSHLNQVPEVVCDNDFYVRCVHLLMNHPCAREMYVAVKDMRDKLLVFLRHECYGNK